MKKRLFAVLLSALILGGAFTGCSDNSDTSDTKDTTSSVSASTDDGEVDESNETSSTVKVNTAYGEVEVPASPARICVLDLGTMDTIDSLGLGDKVVCLQWHKHYPDHLDSYYNSETIVSLTSTQNKGEETTEDTDPYEMYYGIDADIIIGITDKITEELYAVLSQIAPTIALENPTEADDLFTAVSNNTKAIASVWGLEDKANSNLAHYDEVLAQIKDKVNGKTFVITSSNTDLSLIQIGNAGKGGSGNSDSGENKGNSGSSENKGGSSNGGKQKNSQTANLSAFLTKLGMTETTNNVDESAGVSAVTAAAESGTSAKDIAAANIEAINAVSSDVVFIYNYSYTSLDEMTADGFSINRLDDLTAPTCFISNELTYSAGGYTSLTSVIDKLENVFLK